MAAIAGEVGEGLGHEGRAVAVALGDRLDHELEEGVPVRGDQAIVVLPVHFELAVRVLVVVLVGLPAELDHRVADLADDVEAAHQRGLVVAGLLLHVPGIGDRHFVLREQEILALDAGLHPVSGGVRALDLALQHHPGRGFDRGAVHPQIGGEPADLAVPGKLDQALRVGDGEHVGIGGRHVEPGGETREAGALLLHVGDGARRHQLRSQHAEQVDEADQEIADALVLGHRGEIDGHVLPPARLGRLMRGPVSSRSRRAARPPSPPPRR